MLRYLNHHEIENSGLIEFEFYFLRSVGAPGLASLPELTEWTEAVNMDMCYSGGYVYFETEADKAMFILKWI